MRTNNAIGTEKERERERERGELVWLNSVIGDRGTVAG